MIELKNDELVFTFPEVPPKARLSINFQRTLRIPDDRRSYPLPPGLGNFPIKHVDDYGDNVPEEWIKHGGVMIPMYQSEALWLSFNSEHLDDYRTSYPFVIKVATGKICAVTGKKWKNGIHKRPQDYMVAPKQPWLDGYCVEKGFIRQFVAAPLGAGYSAEEQITGEAEHGGIQIITCPMKLDVFKKRFPKRKPEDRMVKFSLRANPCSPEMGIAPGGRMKQEIYKDPYDFNDWDTENYSRCFVHISNSMVWRSITGEDPPTVPFTSKEYNDHNLPWFEYYDDNAVALEGSEKLGGIKSVAQLGKEKGDIPLPENESVDPTNIVKLRAGLKKSQVREGSF